MHHVKAFTIGASIISSVVEAFPGRAQSFARRQVTELRDEYDLVIIGGGTSGLTVAHRVSSAFPQKTVLVIEYGKIEGTVGSFDPPEDGRGATRLVISSPPVASVKNRSASLMLGMTVGGGSAVNGQFLDRGSKYDYDEWARLGSPQFDDAADSWDWEHFGPSFEKSLFLTEPGDDLVDEYGYTWDSSFFAGDSIEASFPPFQWPVQRIGWDAFEEFGVSHLKTCDDGDKHGLCWIPTAQNSQTVQRSHAGVGHYIRVADSLPNLDLLLEHKVTRLVIDKEDQVPAVEFRPVSGGDVKTVRPKREVILSAGAIHTPQILQRSGVASAEYLESEGIEVVEDLPGVGQNFQDHCGVPIVFDYDPLSPNPSDIDTNETFATEAVAQFRERPARGPYTLAMGNSAAYQSLQDVTPQWENIVADIRAQIQDRSALQYLPPTAAETVQHGYLAQLEILAQALEHPEHPILEMPFATTGPRTAFLLKPLSRGSVILNSSDHDATPIVNYATGANPVDLDIMATYVDYFRRIYSTDTWRERNAPEVAPGANVTGHGALVEFVKDTVIQSLMHPCCTAAMLPREKGGVVDSSLSVYGIPGLRVADCSIIPTVPAAHTTTTAYAIGEKAAEIIIKKWEYATKKD
ncbi:hypothetical protein Daus18300_010787 [Diaporthe australafricana]|uniref:GMC oxidoreductase n=1 Tax=Diaporthe australafricana TaxID=127596 RepID=A0ABR3W910_9PEZI